MACEQAGVAGVPYVSFVTNKNAKGEVANYSFVLRGYVRHWLGQVWREFDRIKLAELASPKVEKKHPPGRGLARLRELSRAAGGVW